MPLWDNFADQISILPTASAISATADKAVYAKAGTGCAQAAILNAIPHSLVVPLEGSGVNSSPVQDTTTAKDRYRTPFAITVLRFHATTSNAYASGTGPAFDLYNESDAVSVLDNTSLPGTPLTMPSTTSVIATDEAPDDPVVAQSQILGFYFTRTATSSIGSTWGHVQYVL